MIGKHTSCKYCNRQFHWGTSCGCDGYSEDGFCSPHCKADWFEGRSDAQEAEIERLRNFVENVRRSVFYWGEDARAGTEYKDYIRLSKSLDEAFVVLVNGGEMSWPTTTSN